MKITNKNPFTPISLPIRPNFMIHTFISFGLFFLLLSFSACSTIKLQQSQVAEDKRANLPQNMKSALEDADISKESSCVISVMDDSGEFFIGKDKFAAAQLTDKIIEKMSDKSPDKRIVYIESAVGVKYETIVKLFDSVRQADIDKAGLVAFRGKYEKLAIQPSRFEVKTPSKEFFFEVIKKIPLILFVSIDKTGDLKLNNESIGNAGETEPLMNKLTEVFKERENNGVFREGTNEVEKSVIIKASKSLKYGDVVKVIDAVKLAGAQPIGVQIDDLSD